MAQQIDLARGCSIALEVAGMAVWESSIRSRNVLEGEVVWTGSGPGLLGLPETSFSESYRSFLGRIHADDRQRVLSSMQAAVEARASYDLEYRLLWPDASIHWITSRAQVEQSDDGIPVRTFGVIWDVTERRRLQEKLDLSLEAAGMALWESKLPRGPIHVHESSAGLLGQGKLFIVPSLDAFLECVHAEDRERTRQELESAIAEKRGYRIEYRVVWPDRSIRWIHARGHVYCDAANAPERTVGLLFDITEQKQSERALAEQKELAEVTLSSIGDGIITVDPDGNTRYLNCIAEQLTGWSAAAAKGRQITEILRVVSDETGEVLSSVALKCLQSGRSIGISSAALRARDGRLTPVSHSASPIIGADGRLRGAIVVIHDVSHEHRLKHELSWQASHDPLTGLINRREFDTRLAQALEHAKQRGETHVLLYLDLDQFKIVNDTSGHMAGDELLKQLTAVIHSKVRDSDLFARLGGDEFAILLRGCWPDQARLLADEVRRAVQEFRFQWGDSVYDIGVSIGLVILDRDTLSTSDVMSAADSACYIAKEQGRNRVHVHQVDDAAVRKRHGETQWVAQLAAAFSENRFRLYGQPVAALNGSQGEHNEVLLRMLDAEGHLVAPGVFIPAAERYDRIGAIDRWVIETCLQILAGRGADDSTAGLALTYAVNLSGASLSDEGILSFIEDKIACYHVNPHQLCFEITETAVVRNMHQARLLMGRLKSMGCRFALDDFGSGLSSFSYLKNLPVDYLKIDGAFIKDIVSDSVSRAMVEAIHRIGRVMGMQTIAEWVENEDILQVVRDIGIDYAQGYAVGAARPLQ